LFGLGVENGFVCFVWDRAAVVAFRLDLIAQQQGPTVGLAGAAAKTFAQQVVAAWG
jgi:hypothetical protein